jgi:NAD(P)-dependent dehydrogenase (short-subunit alcohol dehydrogenase family)
LVFLEVLTFFILRPLYWIPVESFTGKLTVGSAEIDPRDSKQLTLYNLVNNITSRDNAVLRMITSSAQANQIPQNKGGRTTMEDTLDVVTRSRLAGTRVAVTGGSGTIGAGIASYLSALGAEVFILDLTPPKDPPKGANFITADVAQRQSLQAASAEIERNGGPINALVNCHGFQIRRAFLDYTDDEWDRVVDVNFTGVFRTCQVFGPALRAQRGTIVNISSVVGTIAARTGVAYGASKAAVSHLTRVLAIEWAPDVRVNAVGPGVVASPLTTELFANPEYAERRVQAIPMKRLVTAQDVAGAVAFLLSADSAMMTGQVLIVDGGFSLQ